LKEFIANDRGVFSSGKEQQTYIIHSFMSITTAQVRAPSSKMKLWYIYVGAFLTAWLVLMFGFGLFLEVMRQWPIAVVMILGSLVAGSTPMGGGAVSFPYLVLWLKTPPDSARNFALAIQALGMTSAMIFILCRRVPIQFRILGWTIVGATVGMFIGTFAIAPRIAPGFVKLIFSCVWMSFAILTMAKNREFCSVTGGLPIDRQQAMRTGLLVGAIGGIIASIIGVGVEMALYTVLVLLYRCDLKIAVPTAVSAMAIVSIMGVAAHLVLGDMSRDVAMKFLAAGPIVIFGAPIGTYILTIIPRVRTLYVISVLCVLQFVWTLHSLERTLSEWAFVAVAMAVAGIAFFLMYRRGRALET
jgi:uncharacterized membrane protein YfcA